MLFRSDCLQELHNLHGVSRVQEEINNRGTTVLVVTHNRDVYKRQTLFGAMPPKGQEMDDHYFGTIRQRIAGFMKDVNIELWKVGVASKTQHNEVAPAQHELAPIYGEANVAVDHNHLVMQTLKRIACQHGMKCLLHEKPFAGVNLSLIHIF